MDGQQLLPSAWPDSAECRWTNLFLVFCGFPLPGDPCLGGGRVTGLTGLTVLPLGLEGVAVPSRASGVPWGGQALGIMLLQGLRNDEEVFPLLLWNPGPGHPHLFSPGPWLPVSPDGTLDPSFYLGSLSSETT